MAVNCQEPDTLESLAPCLNCLSMHELLTVLLVMFSVQNGTDGDVPALKESASRFRNIDDLSFMRELIAALPTSWRSGLNFTDMGGDYPCLKCYGDKELMAMLLNQWCVYWGT